MSDLIDLASGPYRARIDRLGGALAHLSHDGRDLVLDRTVPSQMRFRGDVLVPWPNRIEDGRYSFEGVEHALPLNEPERGNALHGLVLGTTWDVLAHEDDQVRLGCLVPAQDGYPFELAVEIEYALDARGLSTEITAVNHGTTTAPYGVGFHPYLLPAPGQLVEDLELDLGAARYLEVTPDRLLPVALHDVDGTPYDLNGRRLGGTVLDTAFTGLVSDQYGQHRVLAGDLVLEFTSEFGWLQVFTSPDRECLAVEPQTCGPNAFATGDDVVVLSPGERHAGTWRLGLA